MIYAYCTKKKLMTNTSEIKYLDDVFFILRIKIIRKHSRVILGWSQKRYIDEDLHRYDMKVIFNLKQFLKRY